MRVVPRRRHAVRFATLSWPAAFSRIRHASAAENQQSSPQSDGPRSLVESKENTHDPTLATSFHVVRNHELTTSSNPVKTADGSTYDASRAGGTTTLVVDNQGQLVSHFGSLAGTVRNCAGGPTPWGSWLTCEETFSTGSTGIKHGYVFDVPARLSHRLRDGATG